MNFRKHLYTSVNIYLFGFEQCVAHRNASSKIKHFPFP